MFLFHRAYCFSAGYPGRLQWTNLLADIYLCGVKKTDEKRAINYNIFEKL